MKQLLFLILFLVAPSFAHADTFRVAGIYPNHTFGHFNCTCGLEGACITEAAIKRARLEGMNISFTQVNKDWNIFKTMEAAETVVTHRYDAAVGTLVSDDALAAAPILEAAGIPFIVPTATNPGVTAGKKFVTRIPFNDRRQAFLLARLATTELAAKRIVIVRNSSTKYSDFLGTEFARNVRKNHPGVMVNDFPIVEGFTDFKALATRFLAVSPDLVFVPLPQSQLASLYVELVNRKARLTMLASDTIEKKPKFLEMIAPTSDLIQFIYPKHWDGTFSSPESDRYLSLHRKYCGQYEPSMTTMAAYDAAELVIRALKAKPNARGEDLIKEIHTLEYHGMTGPIRYGVDGDPIKPLELYRIKDGDVVHWRRYE